MAFTKKNYVDLTGLSTFKSSLLGTVINDTNKTTTSKTATIKAITDYVDSEVGDLSSAVTEGLANKVSSVTYDSTNKKIVYNKSGSTNTDVVTVATIKSAIGNFVKSGTGASSGLVPKPDTTAGSSKYLREDGTWATPPDTTYSVFVKSGTGAKSGLVPAPSTTAGSSKYLREDGTWTTPPDTNTTYSNATSSSAGLMGADDKAKLDGITASADSVSFSRSLTSGTKVGTITINGTGTDLFAPTNTDTHYTAKNVVASSSTGTGNVGAVTSDPYINLIENGAVRSTHRISGSGATTVKTDASGNIIISSTDTNTTYVNATTSQAGLMGADDKAKLDGIAANANNYSHPAYTSKTSGLYKITVDGTGHVSATTAVTKDDITGLGIPGSDTNTHYTAIPVLGASTAVANATSSVSNPYLNIVENSAKSGGIQIKGGGATTVSAINGVITISSTDTDTNTTYTTATSSTLGLVKSSTTGTASNRDYNVQVNSDGTMKVNVPWTDTNTTYSVFGKSGSTASTGLVPKPDTTAGSSKYLREDGTWTTPPDTNTTYSNATSSSAGLMGADDKAKLDGIATNANNYSHPSYTAQKSGLYKITVDALGHVSGVTSVTKADITGLGIPGSDTQVTSAVGNTTKAYLVGSTSSSDATGTLIKDTNVYLDTTAGQLVATTFSGSLAGNATSSSSIIANAKLETKEAIDGFLEGSKLKYTSFTNYSDIGFGGNDGMILSIPWPGNMAYGAQIAFDDSTSGLVKVRGKSSTWGSWKQLWKEGDSITAPSVTATNGFTGNLAGNADTATKLGTADVGSTSQPIYLSGGTPTALSYTISKSVPANAIFTDTTYNAATSSTLGLVKSSTTGTTASRDYKVEVNSDGTMKVNVPWTDTNTTYTVVDSLDSTDKSACLSANQGRILNEKITDFDYRGRANTWSAVNTFSNGTDVTSGSGSASGAIIASQGGIWAAGGIRGNKVYNAIWNDLADCIPVDDDCELIPGYCYCFDGEKYYKSSKYLDDGIIGIHSDTYGMHMGYKDNCKQMDVAVAGFVLAYVDKEYPVGTPLTCTENGYLTKIEKSDKMEYPEKIVATYWKNESSEYWGGEKDKIKVNGRKWVKIK